MRCKKKQAENAKRHYEKNKTALMARAKEWTKLKATFNRKFVSRYKLKVGCKNCGYMKCATALELHHLDGRDKDGNIGSMISVGCSTSRIKNEIRKCVVLCANCHRELHAAG